MSISFWSFSGLPQLTPLASWPGLIWLLAYTTALTFTLLRNRQPLLRLEARNWLLLAAACGLGALLSGMPTMRGGAAADLESAANGALVASPIFSPLASIPLLIAAGSGGIAPAMLVGFAGGLARAGWVTHHAFAIPEGMLSGALLAMLVQQNYSGRLAALVRRPLPTALAATLLLLAANLFTRVLEFAPGTFSGMEYGLQRWVRELLPVSAELLLAGFLLQLLQAPLRIPWPHPHITRTAPYASSLQQRILFTFVPAALCTAALLYLLIARIASNVATRIVISQMERDAQNVAEGVPFFVASGASLILDVAQSPSLLSADPALRAAELERSTRAIPYFKQLIYFDAAGAPLLGYPEADVTRVGLTAAELDAVNLAQQGVPQQTFVFPGQSAAQASLTFAAPTTAAGGGVLGVLLGRADLASSPLMQPLVASLQGTMAGEGLGFITDAQLRILYHPNPQLVGQSWQLPASELSVPQTSSNGKAFRLPGESGALQLVYFLPVAGQPWNVVLQVPDAAVATQARQITLPLAGGLLLVSVAGLLVLVLLSNRLAAPLHKLEQAADAMTAGKFGQPVGVAGTDEVGRLGESFERMRARVGSQVRELGVLLRATQGVSGSLDLQKALAPILQGALELSEADSAQLVLAAADGAVSQSLSAGAASETGNLNASVLAMVRKTGTVQLQDAASVHSALAGDAAASKLGALLALPLVHDGTLLGTLWLAYAGPHNFAPADVDLLATLAGQAVLGIVNARLYHESESDRLQLSAILKSTPDAVIVTDAAERMLLLNPAAAQLLQVSAQAASGRPLRDTIKQAELVAILRDTSAAKSNGEVGWDDGRTFAASASRITDSSGKLLGNVAVLRDVTNFKLIDQRKSDLVAAVSHHLKNPLTFLRGYATMLPVVGPLNLRQQEYTDKLGVEIDRISKLVEELLNLARIEAAVGPASARCNLSSIAHSLVDQTQASAAGRNLLLEMNLAADLPAVLGDEAQIRIALSNLLENAIKFSKPGGRVLVSTCTDADSALFTVEDTGAGISRADLPRLFDKFFTIKASASAAGLRDQGLGLAIVKSIAERHNGRVWVESQLGKGSTFYFSVPQTA